MRMFLKNSIYHHTVFKFYHIGSNTADVTEVSSEAKFVVPYAHMAFEVLLRGIQLTLVPWFLTTVLSDQLLL
jgi:hypothetical protein